MRNTLPWLLLLSCVLAAPAPRVLAADPDGAATLAELCSGQLPIVDLSHALNDKAPYWPADNYRPFKLVTIATLEKDGVLSKAFSSPEHCGTHLDAPNHFESNQPAVDKIPPAQFFAPAVMIDVSAYAAKDPDFACQAKHVEAWEQRHGRIPDGAIILLNTGWAKFWDNPARFKNQDVRGRLHFPGYAEDAAKLLIHQRQAKGLGIDTLSIDPGVSRKFETHHVVNSARRYGLENVANLDKLPPRGFYVMVAPMKIENGTGGPTRIFAILPRSAKNASANK